MKRSARSLISVSVLAGALTLSTAPAFAAGAGGHAGPAAGPVPGGGPVGCALDGAADLPLGALGDSPGDCLRADRHANRQAKPAPSPLDTAGKLVKTTSKVTHTAGKVTGRLGVGGVSPVGRSATGRDLRQGARRAQAGAVPGALPGGRFVNGTLGQGGLLAAPDVPGTVRSAEAAGLPVSSSMLFPPAGRAARRGPTPGGDLVGQVGQSVGSATSGVGGVQQNVGQVVDLFRTSESPRPAKLPSTTGGALG